MANSIWSSIRKFYRVINHAQIDFTKSLILAGTKFFFDSKSPSDVAVSPKSILIFRLDDKLGDSVASTGFLRELHLLFPEAKLTVLSGPTTALVFRQFKYLNVVIAKRGFLNSILVWWNFKSEKFDLLINTSHILSARVGFFACQIQAKNKISFLNSNWRCFHQTVDFDEWKQHITIRFERCLQLITKVYKVHKQGEEFNLRYELPLASTSQKMQDFGAANSPYIVINSFAAARPRCFTYETTLKIVSELHREFPNHKIVSVASSNDQAVVQDWLSKAKLEFWLVTPFSDFLENAALIQNAALCISPDTSVVHLSCAVGTKTICVTLLETETQPNVWAPYGVPCVDIPAILDRASDKGINSVEVSRVTAAAKSLLKN